MARQLRDFKATREKVGLSRSTILRKEKEGSFPKSIKLGPRKRAWDDAELDQWVEQRFAERDQQAA